MKPYVFSPEVAGLTADLIEQQVTIRTAWDMFAKFFWEKIPHDAKLKLQ
jgi:hypothetical protein